MAKTINTIKELQQYFKGVEGRAKHHAKKVKEIIYPALCLIIAYFDPDFDIKVMSNVIWVHINGTRYAFSYEPSKSIIQIKKNSTKGKVLYSIDNSLTVKELINIFESL
jgi:hypothetical protein